MASTKRIAMLISSSAVFMETIDVTILNTAVPAVSENLSVNPLDLKIALISYCLSMSLFVPISCWLADKFGARRIFIYALFLFTLSSFLCGCSQNLLELTISRTLQGIGGAIMLPVGRLIILRIFEKHEIINVVSQIAMFGALGMMIGPVLGGIITEHFSWPWIFWVNIPVGIVLIILAIKTLPNLPESETSPLDKLGFILFGGGLAGFTAGISVLSEIAIPLYAATAIILISLLLLFIYYRHSLTIANPIIQTKLFKLRSFRISMVGNLTTRLGFGGVPFLLPILLQVGLNYSPEESGLLLAPWAFGILLAKPFTQKSIEFFGYRRLLLINTVIVAISVWGFMSINELTSIYIIGMQTFIYGFVISMQYGAMNSLAYADLTHNDLSPATSIIGTLQQLTMSVGIAICAILMRIFSESTETDLIISIDALSYTFFIMGLIILFSGIIFTKLETEDGRQLYSNEKSAF